MNFARPHLNLARTYKSNHMLNYDDNDQTLAEFYHVRSLKEHVDVSNYAQEFLDPKSILELPLIDQYNTLSNYLDPANQATVHHFTADELRDPLNDSDLMSTLIKKGAIGSQNDPEVNKFLVSSQKFNSQAYLLVVHQDTPLEQLVTSLDRLDHNIRGQTSQLKAVLDENFEGFVSCKLAIDQVLETFKALKSRAQMDQDKSKVFNPATRRTQRKLQQGETLLTELDESMNNLNLSTSLMIRPIMEHHAKEAKLLRLIEFVTKNKFLFDLPNKFVGYLAAHDHDAFIDDYNAYLAECEAIEERQNRNLEKALALEDNERIRAVKEEHALQNTALLRVFQEIENIAGEYRKETFKELVAMDHEVSSGSRRKLALDVKFIDLVNKLHRINLDPNSNPIYDFLHSQFERIKSETGSQRAKFETKFTQMQLRLLDYISALTDLREGGSYVRYIEDKFESVEEYFRASSTMRSSSIDSEKEKIICEIFSNSENLDLSIINETWLVFANYIGYICDYFQTMVAKFVKNYIHYANVDGNYNVDPDRVLRTAFFSFINDEIMSLVNIFETDATTDQMKVSPADYTAFLPYHANSLSTIFYLSEISKKIGDLLTFIGLCTVKIGNSTKSLDTNKQIKSIRDASGVIQQRILEGVCATWVNDCSQFYDLENWEKFKHSEHDKGAVHTKLMRILQFYQLFVLDRLSLLVFENEYANEEVRIVASYPSKRVLVSLEIQFMRSLNVLMDSIVKQYVAEKRAIESSLANPSIEQVIFKILTMNNFTALGEEIYPHLIKKFDNLFDKTLLKQNLKLFADLDKVKITILDDINENEKAWIDSRIDDHFAHIENKLTYGIHIDSFVYDCLMHFVNLVHIFKPIADLETFVRIILELQSQFLLKFLLCLREVSEKEKVIVRIIGNLKLDLDFFVVVFENSDTIKLDDHCLNIVQIALGQIEKVEGIFTDLDYTQKDLDNVLTKALKNSEIEFSCFV